MATSTPAGTAMGRRPIRDIGLPDVRQDFAAELGLAGLRAGHDPLAGADDDDAEAAEDARDVRLAGIDPEAGIADPLEAGHDGDLAVDVAERQPQDLGGPVPFLGDLGDEALGLEDPRDLALRARSRDDDLGVAGAGRVPDPRQHVGAGIGDVHAGLPARLRDARQLALEGALPEADAAQVEAAHEAPRPAADHAAVVGPD